MADNIDLRPRPVRRASSALLATGLAAAVGVLLSAVSLARIQHGYAALVAAVERTPAPGESAAHIAWTLRSGIHLDLYSLGDLRDCNGSARDDGHCPVRRPALADRGRMIRWHHR